jgi:adenine-specific DNA-methyltransferase
MVAVMTSGQGDAAAARKVRGAFFTPAPLCKYVADWAVRTAGDKVLEPSCGEAAFLLAAGERLEILAGAGGGGRGERPGHRMCPRRAAAAGALGG